MASGPSYAILGRGRWAQTMRDVLAREDRHASLIEETRQRDGESDEAHRGRLAAVLTASGAGIAWVCVPPGPHIALMVAAALEADMHVIAEKPWLCSRTETEAFVSAARAKGLLTGVHFEYCLLDGVEKWRREYLQRADLDFGGRFTLSRTARHAIAALEDLGSHLLAIQAYAVPNAQVADIRCSYEAPDERRVWIEERAGRRDTIDFAANKEPIIQRFVARFEAAINGTEFPFGFDFAMRVAESVQKCKQASG